MKKNVLASLVVVLAATGLRGEDEKIAIKVRYAPGTYVVTQKTEMQSEGTVLGNPGEKYDTKSRFDMEMRAEEPQPDGHQKITVAYKHVTHSMAGGGMSVNYDSAHPEDMSASLGEEDISSTIGAAYSAILAVPFEVLLDEAGNVIKVTRMEKSGETAAEEPPAAANNVGKDSGVEAVKAMFDLLKPLTPGTPVATGDTWTNIRTKRTPPVGDVDIEIHCTLEEIRQTPEGQLAVIAFEGKGSLKKAKPPEGAPAAFSLADLIRSMDTECSGKQTIRVDTGLVVALDMDQTDRIDMLAMDTDDPERKGVQGISKSKITIRITPGAYEPESDSESLTEEPTTTQKPAADQ